MIVKETRDHFILIEQDKHAKLSYEIMSYWKVLPLPKSVQTAIKFHDYGWKYFDEQPMWNDEREEPFDFIHFPLAPKAVLYTHGINAVEQFDSYAALLCSVHYTNFLRNEPSSYATDFVNQERIRQKRIIQKLDHYNKDTFQIHYDLLKFADSISLFLCIHPPSVQKETTHPFFRKGILVPSLNERIFPEWQDEKTVLLQPFPFTSKLTLEIEQKVIAKQDIKKVGMVNSYESTAYEAITFNLAPK